MVLVKRYFFNVAFALASSFWLRKPSLSVSSLVNVSAGPALVLLSSERRLHQCFFSPLGAAVLSELTVPEVSALELRDELLEAEAVNSAREMRPSASESRFLNCEAPGP